MDLLQILRQKNIFDTIDTSESKTHTILVVTDVNFGTYMERFDDYTGN